MMRNMGLRTSVVPASFCDVATGGAGGQFCYSGGTHNQIPHYAVVN